MSLNDHSLKTLNRNGNGILIANRSEIERVTWKAFVKPTVTVNVRQNVTLSVTLILSASVTLRSVTNLTKKTKSGSASCVMKPIVVWEKLFFARDLSIHH